MTGYASQSGEKNGLQWDWEIRSVNAKGLDIRVRLPDGSEGLEADLRKQIPKKLTRGSVSVSLKTTKKQMVRDASLNAEALTAALAHLAQIKSAAEKAGLALADPNPTDVLQLPGILDANQSAQLPVECGQQIGDLVAALRKMRAAEGAALGKILIEQLNRVEQILSAAGETSEARLARQGDLLKEKTASLLGAGATVEPERLAQELAILSIKADVTEEIDRLQAHVGAARDLLNGGGPVGRKLDFLMQEFNREANTLCSKSGSTPLTTLGMELKVVIEQMREQVQNLE